MLIDRRLSVAPMMDCTDRHFRFFLRLALKHIFLYSEMVVAQALLNGDRNKLLGFSAAEQPLGLQLAGNDPAILAKAAAIGEQWGYQEINLNVGCPSDKVKNSRFGASLMKEPALVRACVEAMSDTVNIPVTVKCRVGVDDYDSDEWLLHFIDEVAQGGCETFIIHARKAWLKGLNPRKNRNIPALNFDRILGIKQARPHLQMIINGGIHSDHDVRQMLTKLDGVMLGRPAYAHPLWLIGLENQIYSSQPTIQDSATWLQAYLPYIERAIDQGYSLNRIAGHLMGLFHGFDGAKAWRCYITQKAREGKPVLDALKEASDKAFSHEQSMQAIE